jgi:hypothetical protein
VIKRIPKVFAALLLWAVFLFSTIGVFFSQIVLVFMWFFTGDEDTREWVESTGKAQDQLMNAAWFNGYHKETVSSHVGKRYYFHYKFNENFKAPNLFMVFVREVTELFEKAHVFKAIEPPVGIVMTREQKEEAIQLARGGRL